MPEVYLINFFITLALISLLSAFVILLIGKLGIRDYIVTNAPKLISKLFDCDFCLSFWMSLILAMILAIVIGQSIVIIAPLFSTPITRILI